jgi:hypothetical protein
MININTVHAFDIYTTYLRNKELEIHQRKLYEIRYRKNKYADEIDDIDKKRRYKKSPDKDFNSYKTYFLDKDNQY